MAIKPSLIHTCKDLSSPILAMPILRWVSQIVWYESAHQAGNIYVADLFNQRIRKITPAGVVTMLAGGGRGVSTDGQGTVASFAFPLGIAVDVAGYVYVADANGYKIRKISPDGMVTTLAGSGASGATDGIGTAASFSGPDGIAVDPAGNVYVTDAYNHKIRKIIAR